MADIFGFAEKVTSSRLSPWNTVTLFRWPLDEARALYDGPHVVGHE
ncbi:hypothetical protein ACFYP0_29830 [Micromonospora arida]